MISAPLIEYLKKGIFTVLGLMLAVYLFVILLTYTGNDPSWSHISSDMTTINNMGGAMGAWLSDLLYRFFGFGAWWLLVFLVYESVLIWWDNKPAFWLLRVVAYVFLLLSSSALFSQLVAIVQHVADPLTTGVTGVAGGIIGLELQARLAQLLTAWGSAVFLGVFVVITATFAFNIHWQALYRNLTALAWLGSGIKKGVDDAAVSTQYDTTLAPKQHTDREAAPAAQDYEQLPLELQPAYQGAGQTGVRDQDGKLGSALTDFLTNSGLGASVKASMKADAAAEYAASQHTDTVIKNDSRQSTPQNSHSPVQTRSKVEPSFAWNDSDMVEDLLARDAIATEETMPAPPQGHEARASTASAPSVTEHTLSDVEVSEESKSEAVMMDSAAFDSQSLPPQIDNLAEAWLTEHESDTAHMSAPPRADTANDKSSTPTATRVEPSELPPKTTELPEAGAPKSAPQVPKAPKEYAAPPSAPQENSSTPQVSETNSAPMTPQADTSEDDLPKSDSPADMTPSNTPPANPKQAPTVDTAAPQKESSDARASKVSSAKPSVSFAVPEDGASNHITDMMPEDDNEPTPVMPEIHDDAAFATRSRAMQTAKYREQLTPIPELSILDTPDPDREPSYTIEELEQLSELLEIKLQEFNVKAAVVNAIPGPVVTRFEVELAAGVKASKVTGISRDLARSLSMASLRVVEVIPGKPYIGIEVPNKQREMVRLIELLNTEKYKDPKAQISMAMGKDIGGNPIITDLARAPHMLVAGTTGSGKSVLVNSMLLSMLLKYTPNELRLILIDPKQLELANYNDIPHLLTPVVTDMTEAASSLSWCVAEMERRYQLMSLLKVRKLNEFNKKVRAAEQAGKPMLDPLWRPNDNVSIDQAPKLKTLPMIVIVADEFADMIMQVGKQAEELITRLAQKSRAAGIHLMLATQRPSVDVITGLIKANIPVRAALRVNSKVDSRTILDSGGAEDMLGNGDMLFLGPGQIEPDRVHGAYVSDEEVNRVCDAWRERGAPDYIDNMASNFELSSPSGGSSASASGEDDDLYNDAVAFIMETRKVSASSIQRKFSIGYNRAARIVDSMEEAGLVSSMGKSGKRELLM